MFASAPAIRSDSYYRAIFLLHADQIDDPDFFVRFRSAGPHLKDELVLRSIPLPLPWTSSGLISRIVQKSGIGSISKSLKDRTYQAPFVLVDPDLDLVKGKLRVRGRVGVGTGADMVLAQIASIDVTLFAGVARLHRRAVLDERTRPVLRPEGGQDGGGHPAWNGRR